MLNVKNPDVRFRNTTDDEGNITISLMDGGYEYYKVNVHDLYIDEESENTDRKELTFCVKASVYPVLESAYDIEELKKEGRYPNDYFDFTCEWLFDFGKYLKGYLSNEQWKREQQDINYNVIQSVLETFSISNKRDIVGLIY